MVLGFLITCLVCRWQEGVSFFIIFASALTDEQIFAPTSSAVVLAGASPVALLAACFFGICAHTLLADARAAALLVVSVSLVHVLAYAPLPHFASSK
jgi:hypothetical protein